LSSSFVVDKAVGIAGGTKRDAGVVKVKILNLPGKLVPDISGYQ
jgi:hypothetical protein